MEQTGFGGSCHWCTEAIFQSLKGVNEVLQGWIASVDNNIGFSEAVLVTYDPEIISLETLIAIHLQSHSCASEHTMRSKYRSAIYTFNDDQAAKAQQAIIDLQPEFERPIITKVIPYGDFKLNTQDYLNYYYSNQDKPFCRNYISPKLQLLRERFSGTGLLNSD
jgi:peptide-methionine (S)-S-oxide reductase